MTKQCKHQGTPWEEKCFYCDGQEPCCVPDAIQFFAPMAQVPTTTHQMHQVRVVNGKPHFYEPPEVARARAKLLAHFAQHKPEKPFKGALRLTTKWCFPSTAKHKNGEYRITKPDVTNLQKLLEDCMTDLGYWDDDAQIASAVTEKFWSDVPGIFIRIEKIGDECKYD
ncbi:MAG: RusA family crossover junction endodeoxyribonuclease [Candidatus Limiplasma sp.]|nr:RusA family crossover junction endodeoxyribonuclease [Candidatus Limiplasma sp.]